MITNAIAFETNWYFIVTSKFSFFFGGASFNGDIVEII